MLPESLDDDGAEEDEEGWENQRQDGHHLSPGKPTSTSQRHREATCPRLGHNERPAQTGDQVWLNPGGSEMFIFPSVNSKRGLTSWSRGCHHIFAGNSHKQCSATGWQTSGGAEYRIIEDKRVENMKTMSVFVKTVNILCNCTNCYCANYYH